MGDVTSKGAAVQHAAGGAQDGRQPPKPLTAPPGPRASTAA